MKDLTALLALPASLLSTLLIPTIDAQGLQWPHNLPRTIKYYPEHERHMKRHAEVQSRLAQQTPIAVRKMSDDHGQKFFLDYWGFEELEYEGETRDGHGNESMIDALRQTVLPHTNHDREGRHLFGRNVFARDYDCPANTNSCASIGNSDVCCPSGETCVNTSAGVGCCPSGQTCGDTISDCDANEGYTQCDTDSNSGCCVPGASCESGGCVFYGTQTVYTTLPTARVTTGVSTTIETSSGREITVVYTTVQSSAYTTTETVTATPSGYTTTRTIVIGGGGVGTTATPSTCATGFFSCPASLGGGCCPNGQNCASDDLCPDSTSPAGAPIIPASSTDTDTPVSAATITSTPTTTYATDNCPTGFYMCSARYLGGCCRVDRNCDTTSCPPQDSTTVVSDGGATVAAATTGGENCAVGWALCPAGQGGGCCPSGFSCGQESCSASGQQDTQKMEPSRGSRLEAVVVGWTLVVVGIGAGVGMIWL